jgi:hypothetical protein
LPGRIAGVVLMGMIVMVFDATSGAALHELVLPLGMALAAWLMVQNAAAVLLGITLLAAIHTDPASPDWVIGRAYPAVAILSGGVLVYIALQRFRKHIEATREARWSRRGK